MNKKVLWNIVSSVLIIAMFLLQYSPQLEKFKYWICFVIVVASCGIIVYNTFAISYKFSQANKRIGAHAKGHNQNSIGICYEGGLDCHGHPADTRTEWQIHSMRVLILALLRDYPGCRVCGHRDLSPDLNGNGEIEPEEWIKACPCFEVKEFCSKM
jgi:hypothetical protein